jgi:hypothetical protein
MPIRYACVFLALTGAFAQPAPKLKLTNVKAEPATYKGKACIRITEAATGNAESAIASIEGSDFEDGVIEVELAGDTRPNADPTARGFTGMAFRLTPDGSSYEAFYLRPKNGRAEHQEQRNHSAQYISVPDFPWERLRKETPGRYESYVDLVPGEWTRMKIVVHGDKARLYVHGAEQPSLVVNDLKHGKSRGGIAYWVGPGTVAHFANLKITRE